MGNRNSRYINRPLLRLFECYVLDAIDSLDLGEIEKLEAITPKLKEIYGVEGSWTAILEKVLSFPPNFKPMIREVWEKNTEKALRNGEKLLPEDFAIFFTDVNMKT